MTEPHPDPDRWEYRQFWPAGTDSMIEPLQALADGPVRCSESAETYLVLPSRLDLNIKWRAQRLDIKRLRAVDEGLQQWQALGKWSFPLNSEAVHAINQLCGLTLAEADLADWAALIERSRDQGFAVSDVQVTKQRQQWPAQSGWLEHCRLIIQGRQYQSICLEHHCPDTLRQWLDQLSIDANSNRSYAQFLAEVAANPRR